MVDPDDDGGDLAFSSDFCLQSFFLWTLFVSFKTLYTVEDGGDLYGFCSQYHKGALLSETVQEDRELCRMFYYGACVRRCYSWYVQVCASKAYLQVPANRG